MAELAKILLVPVDGSECATEAAEYAGKLAMQLNVPLRLLFAYPETALELWGGVSVVLAAELDFLSPEVFAKVRQKAAEAAFQPAKAVLAGLQLEPEEVILGGDPGEAVLRHAAEIPGAMIVIGRRGLSSFRHVFLGSVTQRILQHAKCPVLVIR